MESISQKRAERIARNINAMDMNYHYSDDMKVWKFWSGLDRKLKNIIKPLSETDRNIIKQYCIKEKAAQFGIN